MSKAKAPAPSYRHTSFGDQNSVRILSLQPGSSEDTIRITLQEASIDQLPNFEALSYAWESQTPEYPVLCGKSKLLITENCFAALRRLRSKHQERLLWIDSICIDQNSLEEREHQVQLMGDLYSRAVRVVIWLGEGTELSDFAMDYMKDCHKIRSSSWQRPVRRLLLGRKEKSIIEKEKQLVRDDCSWEDLMKSVFTRSWFTRIWAVQEYVLSKDAVFKCGSRELNSAVLFSEFREFENRVYQRLDPASHYKATRELSHPNYSFPVAAYIQHFETLRKSIHGDETFQSVSVTDLLINARMQVATYPKDAVFGMFGILQRSKINIPLPSYTDSVEDIYTQITQAAIEQDQGLAIIIEAGECESYPNLPSWCPDWNATPSHALTQSSNSISMSDFRASENTKYDYEFIHSGRLLRVTGAIVDEIVERSSFHVPGEANSADSTKAHLASREAFRDSITFASMMTPYPTAESWSDVLRETWLTTKIMVPYERPTGYARHELSADFKYWLHSLQIGIESSEIDAYGESKPRLTQAQDLRISRELGKRPTALALEEEVYNEAAGLRLFKTAAGYLGKSVPSIEEGDSVILISGVAIPMIARAVGTQHKLIGPSYIHGIMEGERWPHDESDLIDIILR